ncbi:hypothetical protein SAMN06297387_1229 [Streptomyces zhaozhouensis]|uniref:Uncharacterized protein n=1 Tax=Streptomyces zhaozhouensis TaxID=1300267 RepID=A0A286E3F5_9ACTN|nr:hypothetical protein [Streptomyces zhaozhouensis]SOD65432.1 hypothetical protein SAMN06297387_1229 [Streptomyces zhaozhouensis]
MDATAVATAPAVTAVAQLPVHDGSVDRPTARSQARAEARAARIAARRHAATALQSALDRRDNGGAVEE